MATKYIHELKDWPKFRWNRERLAEQLAAVRHRQGRLVGRMEGLGFTLGGWGRVLLYSIFFPPGGVVGRDSAVFGAYMHAVAFKF